MTTPNVFVKVGTTMAKVQPVRAALVKHQLEQASKVKTAKQFRAALQRCKDKREYPRFVEGQSTEQYVQAYWALNGSAMGLASQWVNRNTVRRPLDGEVQRLINGLYEPLSTNPQYTPLFDGVEESI